MKEFARKQREENSITGLVPTMGALHQGHLSLIKQARQQCSSVVASIFVNPTQFAPSEDFAKYPRTLSSDTENLENAGVQCLFLPEAKEIYPQNYATFVNVEGLSDRLEGRVRPGHFRGVSTVVMKLVANRSAAIRIFWQKRRAADGHHFADGGRFKSRH